MGVCQSVGVGQIPSLTILSLSRSPFFFFQSMPFIFTERFKIVTSLAYAQDCIISSLTHSLTRSLARPHPFFAPFSFSISYFFFFFWSFFCNHLFCFVLFMTLFVCLFVCFSMGAMLFNVYDRFVDRTGCGRDDE